MGFEFLVRAAFHVKELLPVDLQVDAQAAVGYVPKLYPWIQSAAVGLVKCCQIPLILQFPGGGAAQQKSGQGEDEDRSCRRALDGMEMGDARQLQFIQKRPV